MREESDRTNRLLERPGAPDSPERLRAIPNFKAETLEWANRIQTLLNEHAEPPRYLTRTLQRYIDGLLLYSENMYTDRGPGSLRQHDLRFRALSLWRTARDVLQSGRSVVAVGAGEAKPNRQFSDFILGGLWPQTSPGPWSGAANAQRTFAQTSRAGARDVSASASAILGDNDGAMIEAMHVIYQDDSKAVEAQSDLFDSMADAIDECAGIVKDARLQLDAIDREAHEAIQKIIDGQKGGCVRCLGDAVDDLGNSRAGENGRSGGFGSRGGNIASQDMRIRISNRAHAGRQSGAAGASRPLPSGREGTFLHGG